MFLQQFVNLAAERGVPGASLFQIRRPSLRRVHLYGAKKYFPLLHGFFSFASSAAIFSHDGALQSCSRPPPSVPTPMTLPSGESIVAHNLSPSPSSLMVSTQPFWCACWMAWHTRMNNFSRSRMGTWL